jgi:hypothetical protein
MQIYDLIPTLQKRHPFDDPIKWLSKGIGELAPLISDTEKAGLLVIRFANERANGGLMQFIENSSGDEYEDVLWALRLIGAADEVGMLEKAKLEIFNGRDVPSNDCERGNIVDAWRKRVGDAEEDRMVRDWEKDIDPSGHTLFDKWEEFTSKE